MRQEVVVMNGLIWQSGRDIFDFEDGDLTNDDWQDLVMMSLFTWRRALDRDPIGDRDHRQGWYGDSEFGSRLWLALGGKLNRQLLIDIGQYATQSLEWLIEDGLLSEAKAVARARGTQVLLDLDIKPTRDPEDIIRFRYILGSE